VKFHWLWFSCLSAFLPAILTLIGLACPWSAAAQAADDAPRPNIIFILSDDVAQGDLGCYGQKLIHTPRLDRMAAEGTRYTQTYCGTSVCAPSRSSVMTARFNPRARSRCRKARSPLPSS